MNNIVSFTDLVGKTIVCCSAKQYDTEITFQCSDGTVYGMSCSEIESIFQEVKLEEIVGDIEDILNTPICLAEESSNSEKSTEVWTFYTIRTNKGTVVFRWLGWSEGYYAMDADFYQITSNITKRN